MDRTTVAVAAADRVEAVSAFQRRRHLAFSVAGLAHGPLTDITPSLVVMVTDSTVWSAEIATANAAMLLCFAAFVAWLAFAVFDTHADVPIFPKRWDLGVPLAAWCVVQEIYAATMIWRFPDEHQNAARWWLMTFISGNEYRFGWSAAMLLMHAAAEEIVYRALLLRALEGYMHWSRALVLQAIVFELVHAFVYGYGLTGVWFIGGLVLGYAFQRTRSLAVPTLLHAAHNILFFTLVWYFNK